MDPADLRLPHTLVLTVWGESHPVHFRARLAMSDPDTGEERYLATAELEHLVDHVLRWVGATVSAVEGGDPAA